MQGLTVMALARIVVIATSILIVTQGIGGTPEDDRLALRALYEKRFPGVAVEDYINGVYAIDPASREQWLAIEEFPPYEFALDEGEALFNTPFANGRRYADCFANGGMGIRQNYPYFDTATGQVKTLELEINECRQKHGEKPYKYKRGKIALLSAYMAHTSRGNRMNIVIPDDPRAKAAYEDGKKLFYARRGQLNMACATCHVTAVGSRLRAEVLSPAVGHVTHFPVYRLKWGELGTLHRRFAGCYSQLRAKPFKAQSVPYRNLEYFMSFMSNGLEVNGPGARK